MPKRGMVMDTPTPTPQSVGREFVRQYYTLLNKAPLHLHRFYSGDSSFVHGGLEKDDKTLEPVHGQQEIHEKIMQLNFRECKAKVRQVDAHATLASGVVVQVLGELSNNHQPMRRFMQTFVLAPQSAKKYYVYNDIFRYQDEVFGDLDLEANSNTSFDEADKYRGQTPSDGIATVSIIDGVQKEPHLNGGSELSPRVPVEVPPSSIEPSEPESEELELIAAPPAPVIAPKEEEVKAEPLEPELEHLESTPTATDDQEVLEEKPVIMKEEVVATAVAPAPAIAPANPEPNEKPTYANLFKKSGNTAVVATGSISLPPAGFGKSGTSQVTSSSSNSTTSPPTGPNGPLTTNSGASVKENSPAGFQGGNSRDQSGKPFRGNSARGGGSTGGSNNRGGQSGVSGGGSGHPTGSGQQASRDRYHPSRESVSSNAGDENAPNAANPGRGGGSRMGNNTLNNFPDSHQVFVGNLPHHCQESDLEELFSKFGKVVDVRINNKGVAQSRNLTDSQKSVPNFGFVVFEDEKAAMACLTHKPINLPNGHRLNVETKKKNNRDDSRGSFGSFGGANRGSGNNFDRGSQEQLGGLGRGGLNSNSGRSGGGPRGGSRGGGRGGFSGSRGGGHPGGGPPVQGGIPGAGGGGQHAQRTTYTRRS